MDQDGSLHERFGTNHTPRYYLGDGSRRSMLWISIDQRTEDCVGMAFPVPGKSFEDGSRRSIGWIDVDCYIGDLTQFTLSAIPCGSRRSMRWIRMDQHTEKYVGVAFSVLVKSLDPQRLSQNRCFGERRELRPPLYSGGRNSSSLPSPI